MKPIKLFLVILMLAFTASAQITVTQQFVDDANAAFREVVALRQANTALIGQVAAEQKAKDANILLAESRAEFITLLKADNADLRKLKCDQTSFFFIIKIKRCR